MSKIKVRFQAHCQIYIHNDLANAAYYFKARVGERIANDTTRVSGWKSWQA